MFLYPKLKLNEWIFLFAGVMTLFSIPFLEAGGFYLWVAIKIIYLSGLATLFYVRD